LNLTDQGNYPRTRLRSRLGATGLPTITWRLLTEGDDRLGRRAVRGWVDPVVSDGLLSPGGRPAPDWQPRQPVGVFGLLASQHRPELVNVVPALGGDLVAHAPDFFQKLVFHSAIIPGRRPILPAVA